MCAREKGHDVREKRDITNRTVAETARMICLANSDKHNGRCTAGIRTDRAVPESLHPVGMTE